jgi:hypothetical protein
MPAPQSQVLTFEDARRAVEDHASRLALAETEAVDLLRAAGRILAEPITPIATSLPSPLHARRLRRPRRRSDDPSLHAQSNRRDQSRAHSIPVPPESRRSLLHHDWRARAAGRRRRRHGRVHLGTERFSRNHKRRRARRKHRRSGSRGQTRQPFARSRHAPQRSRHRPRRLGRQIAPAGIRSSACRHSDHG